MRKIICFTGFLLAWTLCCLCAFAADDGLVAWWRFDEEKGKAALDSVSQNRDAISGNFKYVQGAAGNAIKFDGYTTYVARKAEDAPRLVDAFTIEAWIAPQTYPWNWTAIVNQEKERKEGYFFGVSAEGRVGLHVCLDGEWYECISQEQIPLLQWTHILGSFDKEESIKVYINGKQAGSLSVCGQMIPPEGQDLLVGKSQRKMYPKYTEREPSRRILSSMVFDGLIDEVKIYNRALSAEQIKQSYEAVSPAQRQPLTRRVLPSGPKGAGQFRAHYCNLKYCEEWDSLFRSSGADVVVRFDFAPIRLVSWRGISYNPCWVTENGNWFSNEFMERGTAMGCGESMSDKQARYSHIKILENNDARAVLYWRYSPVDIVYQPPNVDEQTGWGDWAEEYWTVYPDGVAARKVVMWSSREPFGWAEWCQSLPIFQPGQRPEDVLDEDNFLSLANMAGQSRTYRWPPDGPAVPGANIQIVNYKSRYKPFLILTDKNPRIWFAKFRMRKAGEELRGMSMPLNSKFWWWNHWPVAQIPNDGRVAEFGDRPSHSYTSTQDSDPYEVTENWMIKIMLCGLTEKSVSGLLPLARSWCRAPRLELISKTFVNNGYDATQRAYVLTCKDTEKPSALEFALNASEDSPAVNPAFVIKGWGRVGVCVKVNGQTKDRGVDLHFGHCHGLESNDLIVWLKVRSAEPVRISLLPATD